MKSKVTITVRNGPVTVNTVDLIHATTDFVVVRADLATKRAVWCYADDTSLLLSPPDSVTDRFTQLTLQSPRFRNGIWRGCAEVTRYTLYWALWREDASTQQLFVANFGMGAL